MVGLTTQLNNPTENRVAPDKDGFSTVLFLYRHGDKIQGEVFMKDITGHRYGKWTVICHDHKDNTSKEYWKCLCECGREYVVRADQLKGGVSKSCLFCRSIPLEGREAVNKYVDHQNYIECIVRNGDAFIFDKDDHDLIGKYTWTVNGVVSTNIKRRHERIQNLLMCPEAGYVVDHINHNPKDNRRANLRLCSQHENAMNCLTPVNNTSGYKGVSWSKRRNKWQVYIKHNYKHIYIGQYANKTDAARAYNQTAEKLFGEYACLNAL